MLIALIAEYLSFRMARGRSAACSPLCSPRSCCSRSATGSQRRLDRFFYRDRLDYRRTLIEFGRTLTNEVHIEPMLGSVMDRISQTLLVDRLAIFWWMKQPGQCAWRGPWACGCSEPLDLSFLDPARPRIFARLLFFTNRRDTREKRALGSATLSSVWT